MVFKRYRVQLIGRALLLIGSTGFLAMLIGWTEQLYAPAAVGVLLVFQIISLIQYAEKAPRDILHFLQAIRQADFTQQATTGDRGPLFLQLSDAYGEVLAEFKRVRGEKEEHFHYLQTVVHHIGIALISFRGDGSVVLVNTAAKRLLGQGQLRNIRDMEAWSPAFVQQLMTLESGERVILRVSQEDLDLQLAVFATRLRLKGQVHTLVSLQDIKNELEEKEMDAWQKLTRVLTHEIMNSTAPIASLAATASGMLRRTGQIAVNQENGTETRLLSDTRDALEAIERRSEALMHFVESYRSFSKIPKPVFRVVIIQDVLKDVYSLFRYQAQEHNITINVQIDPLDLELTADPELVEQILINLFLNAMDALSGQPKAQISLLGKLDRLGRPIIQVVDNGPGIPDDLQERVFIPFFTTKNDGSGIGLSLSRQIMRLHGGSLNVRSVPNQETIFTLQF